MGSFAVRLSETAPTWGSAVAPIAEWVTRTLWATVSKHSRISFPATRLTQQRKRMAKGRPPSTPIKSPPKQPSVCRICGATIKLGKRYCASCALELSTERLMKAAKVGRIAAQSPPKRLSALLIRDEVETTLAQLNGFPGLPGVLFYGSVLRILEGTWLEKKIFNDKAPSQGEQQLSGKTWAGQSIPLLSSTEPNSAP